MGIHFRDFLWGILMGNSYGDISWGFLMGISNGPSWAWLGRAMLGWPGLSLAGLGCHGLSKYS